jgi:hypothetical protein
MKYNTYVFATIAALHLVQQYEGDNNGNFITERRQHEGRQHKHHH